MRYALGVSVSQQQYLTHKYSQTKDWSRDPQQAMFWW